MYKYDTYVQRLTGAPIYVCVVMCTPRVRYVRQEISWTRCMHVLIPSMKACDALHLERRSGDSKDTHIHLGEDSQLCQVLRAGDVVVPGRKVKARSRSNTPRRESVAVVKQPQEEESVYPKPCQTQGQGCGALQHLP